MEADTSSQQSIVDILKFKDTPVDIPKEWAYVKANKNEYFLEREEESHYQHNLSGKCVTKCFTNMQSPVVANEESECMTNCIGKGMETASLFIFY